MQQSRRNTKDNLIARFQDLQPAIAPVSLKISPPEHVLILDFLVETLNKKSKDAIPIHSCATINLRDIL